MTALEELEKITRQRVLVAELRGYMKALEDVRDSGLTIDELLQVLCDRLNNFPK
jgi:hypothetical protein